MSFDSLDAHNTPPIRYNGPIPSTNLQLDLLDEEILFVLTLQEILTGQLTSLAEIPVEDERLRPLAYNLLLEKKHGGESQFWRHYDALATGYPFLSAWRALVEDSSAPCQSASGSPRLAGSPGILVSEVIDQEVDWLWEPMVPLGTLTLLDGDPGTGKSLVLCDLAARVTRGWPMPDGTPGIRAGVVIIAPEDQLSRTIKPRLKRAGADLSQVVCLNEVQQSEGDDPERPFLLKQDLAQLEEAILSVQAKLVILDPLSDLIGRKEIGKEGEVRVLLAPLRRLMERLQVACIMVRHLMKKGNENALYRGAGSIAFIALARSALLAVHDPQDQTRQLLIHCKNNLGPLAQSLAYRISNDRSTGDGRPYITWQGSSPLTTRDLAPSARTVAALGPGRQLILDLLNEQSGVGLTPQQIAEKLPEMGMNNIRVTLKRMVGIGQICQPQRGIYAVHSA